MTCHLANAQYVTSFAGGDTGRLFLAFCGTGLHQPVSINCPLVKMS